MTYSTAEASANSGAPIELYEFAIGVATHYYTSADVPITIDLITYEPVLLNRGDITQTGELNKTGLEIRMARDNPIADLFRVSPPDQVVVLTILRVHRTSPGDTIVFWSGRVLTPKWEGSEATLYCEPVSTSLKRPGLRRKYSKMCPHPLYSNECRVNTLTHQLEGYIASVEAISITVTEAAGRADGYFSGGYISWADDYGNIVSRTIETHTGSTLVLLTSAYGLSVGDALDIYPGCDHTLGHCGSKFGNTLNYGGFPWISSNPFDKEVF